MASLLISPSTTIMQTHTDQKIRDVIKNTGRITFAEFMEIVMFYPNLGYYTSATNVTDLDYYTAATTHPSFGALLAFQLEQIWDLIGKPTQFHVLEMGSGSGALREDILAYSEKLNSSFRNSIEYISVDYRNPSISEYDKDTNFVKAESLPFEGLTGCILSNELIDAFPVHRFVVNNGDIQEIFLEMNASGEIQEILDTPSTPEIRKNLEEYISNLPSGFTGEVNLKQLSWVENINSCLEKGLILTIDYGGLANQIYSKANALGTVRCYYRHEYVQNPYIRLGSQDITSLVNFTPIIEKGESLGLRIAGFSSQRDFLINLGFNNLMYNLRIRSLPQMQSDSNRMAMLNLIKPGSMGDFRVLAQVKGISGSVVLHGFNHESPLNNNPSSKSPTIPETPLITRNNLDFMSQRYPHTSWDWDNLWPWNNG